MASVAVRLDNGGMAPRPPAGRRPQKRPRRKNFIRDWRRHRGLSQGELAARSGISEPTISLLENAKIGFSSESLEAIAAALDCETGDLLSYPPPSAESKRIIDALSEDELAKLAEIVKTIGRKS